MLDAHCGSSNISYCTDCHYCMCSVVTHYDDDDYDYYDYCKRVESTDGPREKDPRGSDQGGHSALS